MAQAERCWRAERFGRGGGVSYGRQAEGEGAWLGPEGMQVLMEVEDGTECEARRSSVLRGRPLH